MISKSLEVSSYRGQYNVQFANDTLKRLEETLQSGDWLFIDVNVERLYAERLKPLTTRFRIKRVVPTEQTKSYDGVRPIISELIESGFKKNNRIVAIGGGITQDVASFIASILYRGVDWIFVPTNLLSQCDSCIGSKTSINFKQYKNQIGGFFPPSKVFIDTAFLDTLDDIEIRSGLGEMAHYFLVENETAYARFEAAVIGAIQRGPILTELISESLTIKQRMVELDEFDKGPRVVFNYGHSFGHALESYTNYKIPHGIAVSYGIEIANAVSQALGMINQQMVDRVHHCMRSIRPWIQLPPLNIDAYLELLMKDKKNTDSALRVVLTKGFGRMFLHEVKPDKAFRNAIQSSYDRFCQEPPTS